MSGAGVANAVIQVDYRALEEVRQRFSRNAEAAMALRSQVEKRAAALLQGKAWAAHFCY